jgi:hypothetical protein
MSISNDILERDELLKTIDEAVKKLNKDVEDIGEKIKTSDNVHMKKLQKNYEEYCKTGDCEDIDHINNLLQYLENSYDTAKTSNVKDKIKVAMSQVKNMLDIKY